MQRSYRHTWYTLVLGVGVYGVLKFNVLVSIQSPCGYTNGAFATHNSRGYVS